VTELHPVLAEAIAPVLHDLRQAGVPEPELRADDWGRDEDYVTGMLERGPWGHGVRVSVREPLADRIAWVADQVQDWAVEELCAEGLPTNWPQCPEHPGNHPLAPVVRAGRAVWACPKSGDEVAEIGSLSLPGQG
jgi:hypothetical protein